MGINNLDILVQFHKKYSDYLIVSFKNNLRNEKWTKYLGLIQNLCENILFPDKKINRILFDISECSWIDPLPALSLCILIKQYHLNIRFSIKVPLLRKNNATDVVLKFLKKEGFFDIIRGVANFYDNDSKGVLSEDKIKAYSHISSNLTYTNASLLPFIVVDLKEIEKQYNNNLDDWIDQRILEIRANLTGFIPESQLGTLIYKIKSFYGETLHNIKKHAYKELNMNTTYAGLYTRLRFGSKNESLSNEEKNRLKYALSNESLNCPRLEKEYAE